MLGKNPLRSGGRLAAAVVVLALPELVGAQGPAAADGMSRPGTVGAPVTITAAGDLGISFVEGSASQMIIRRNDKQYIVDVVSHTIREVETSQSAAASTPPTSDALSSEAQWSSSAETSVAAQGAAGSAAQATDPSPPGKEKQKARNYDPGDDLVFSVPTGRRLDRHGFYINFTHRFPYEASFKGTGRGNTLLGLDDFSVSSFGFRFGVTSKLSVMAYRSPSIIGRPIELMAAYNFLDERDKKPLNAALRFSVDAQNNFATNYTENFELILSRSLGHRAQLFGVPTFSIHNRPVLQNPNSFLQEPMPDQSCKLPLAAGIDPSFNVHPCADTFSIGVAAAVDVRPTVAIVAEAIPTLVNGRDLGIHRAPFAFGVKKKIWRHAFTLGFTNSPGTLVSNRAGTNATYLQKPGADTPEQMFIGFDLTRQVY